MFGLGMGELVVILVIMVLVFGGSRLPELGRGLGEGMRSFRDAIRGEAKRPPDAGRPGDSGGSPGGSAKK